MTAFYVKTLKLSVRHKKIRVNSTTSDLPISKLGQNLYPEFTSILSLSWKKKTKKSRPSHPSKSTSSAHQSTKEPMCRIQQNHRLWSLLATQGHRLRRQHLPTDLPGFCERFGIPNKANPLRPKGFSCLVVGFLTQRSLFRQTQCFLSFLHDLWVFL